MKKSHMIHYDLKLNKKGLSEGKISAVFLTDMHNCMWGEGGSELLRLVDELDPELVLCGGDMPVAHPGVSFEPAADFMKCLSEKRRIYYAMGNHEYRMKIYPETYGSMYEDYMAALKDSDIIFLDNENTQLNINGLDIRLYGLSIEREYYKRFSKIKMPAGHIEELIGRPDNGAVNILLAHTPKYISEYMAWGADVSLSGHYHGGVVGIGNNHGLISPDLSLMPYNAHGYIKKDGRYAIISSGLGEHTIPVRINNPRELVSFEIHVNERLT